VIDVWGIRKWAFGFVVIGMNAITVYAGLRFFDGVNLYMADKFVGGITKWLGCWGDFVRQNFAFALVWLILYWMYRKKTFIKI
jgi:predicted acyltransferase